jgi:molybdopterin synthase sulfur carrier subunit
LIAKIKSIPLNLPAGKSVMDAIQAIVGTYPVLRSHWLDENAELHAHVHVFLNGHDIATLPQGLDTPLQSQDVLDFFPPVAGG